MKELKEFGVAHSSRILAEAEAKNVDVDLVARGYTYTTRDDGFPSTNLACDDNPFANDVLLADAILDFGCGVGRNLPWIHENTHAHYYGVDPNPVMLDNFWKVTDPKYDDGTVWLGDSFENIPENTGFDVVVSTFVMQHLAYEFTPEGVMNLTDITQEIMKYTREGTIWFLLEHEMERPWLDRWFDENDIEPDVFIMNYGGQPDLVHRGQYSHLVIWRQNR